jgi:hypothetical protein
MGADDEEELQRQQADDGVGFAADQRHARRWTDRDSTDDARLFRGRIGMRIDATARATARRYRAVTRESG